ncbi:prepilin-type N-terminal cleavage/methylation domain-containing protein [Paenibacillus sp. HJGM_3]|uniref:prepilin-type N-terminal cleavage/methylation domain-containing protein n=1 Tax=Paenibacillus sp. HJGM_3 TaxID=3379816 RepID=UPI00385C9E3F
MTEMVLENNQIQGLRARKLSIREVMKNEKGLTLIELLAVIVIIAIIAAIAIPSIGSIMEKTRLNAHRSNAHMVIDAARLYVTSEGKTLTAATTSLTLSLTDLHSKGYLEVIPKDPSNKPENYAAGAAGGTDGSFVTVAKDGENYKYTITLKGATTTYMTAIDEANIEKSDSVVE